MAVRVLRPAFLLAAAVSLGSCQVLEFVFGSVFPAETTLVKAQADLSSQIPANMGTAFNVRVVEPAGYGYVVVIGNASSGNSAYFYDLDLNFKASFSGFGGNGVLVDPSGNIAMGSYILDPATLVQTGTLSGGVTPLNASAQGGVDGFVVTSSSVVADVYIANGTTTLNSSTYTPWTASLPNTAVSISTSGLQLDAVLDNGNQSPNVTLVVSPSSSNNQSRATCYFVTTAKSTFPTGIPSADTSPRRDNLETGTIGWAQGSIFAYDSSSSSFVRIDPSTASIQNSLASSTDPSETRYAYRIGGGSFYGFNTKSRVLTKYTQWW
ncbi:MAG TPA: hypothetical protein VMU36_12970 [Spirochaetia bacterium]|nr:hypothetical protein [Spirochaetia bacterium]